MRTLFFQNWTNEGGEYRANFLRVDHTDRGILMPNQMIKPHLVSLKAKEVAAELAKAELSDLGKTACDTAVEEYKGTYDFDAAAKKYQAFEMAVTSKGPEVRPN